MNETYDCTNDVMMHKRKVEYWMRRFWESMKRRAPAHDNSKLDNPVEKATFDQWSPVIRQATFGTDEYKTALDSMGAGLDLHYKANRHHPEHYSNGVNDMTIIDFVVHSTKTIIF